MKPFEDMKHHSTSEQLVNILRDHTQQDDPLFFRLVVGYYFSLVASHMRCTINSPDRGRIPVNMYVLNLAPSGYGKTMSTNLMEGKVLNKFRIRFIEETFPILAEENLPKLAIKRSNRKKTDPDFELENVQKEFERTGNIAFSFDSGTGPAVKQMRHKLLMANAGSMNLIMDEVGANLTANTEVFDTFIELFDKGLIKQKLVKNTNEAVRSEEIIGKTPANLLMFGVANRLLDGAKTEEALLTMLGSGYARRCFFGYIPHANKKVARTAEQMYDDRTNVANKTVIHNLADRLDKLADIINANKTLIIKKATCITLNEYQLNCEIRAEKLPEHQELLKRELSERSFKVLKLAGAYAFIDDVVEITEDHIFNAIKLAEESGKAFVKLLARDKAWVRLAKYIAAVDTEVTQADLAEDLPFYKGSAASKADLLNLATAYGYSNNIIIKKTYMNGVEFLRGETLKLTDLTKTIISYSKNITTGYINERVPFDKLHKVTQATDFHWISHHLVDGYRNEENAMPGFSLAVIDVDGGISFSTAKLLLKDYTFLIHTTKRSTDKDNRFRIIMPLSHELLLDSKDYKEFMSNLFQWLPFNVDAATNHRCKKWLSNPGQYEYNQGELLDALPFIPKTAKSEERKILLDSQQSMDNLERWVINNITGGNRNNILLRFAMILVDGGYDFEAIRQRIMGLNEKLTDRLEESEIMSTVMVTVGKQLSNK